MSMFSAGGADIVGRWQFELQAEIAQVQAAMGEATNLVNSTVAGMERQAERASRAWDGFGRLANRAMGVAAAGAGVAMAGMAAMRTAVERRERDERRLVRAMQAHGKEAERLTERYNSFARELREFSIHSQREILALTTTIAELTRAGEEDLEVMTAAAVGLAARFEHMGLSADQASRMISRAWAGNFSGMQRYGIMLDDTLTSQQKFARLLEMGVDGLRDARAETETTAGAIRRLWSGLQDLAVAGGNMLGLGASGAQIFNTMTGWIASATALLERMTPRAQDAAAALKDFFGVQMHDFSLDSILTEIENIWDTASTRAKIFWQEMKLGAADLLDAFEGLFDVGFFESFIRSWGLVMNTIENLTDSTASSIMDKFSTSLSDMLTPLVGIVRGVSDEAADTLSGAVGVLRAMQAAGAFSSDAVLRRRDERTKSRMEAESRAIANLERWTGSNLDATAIQAEIDRLWIELSDRISERERGARERSSQRSADRESATAKADQEIEALMKRLKDIIGGVASGSGAADGASTVNDTIQTVIGAFKVGQPNEQLRELKQQTTILRQMRNQIKSGPAYGAIV